MREKGAEALDLKGQERQHTPGPRINKIDREEEGTETD